MSTKEKLYQIIDDLTDTEAESLLNFAQEHFIPSPRPRSFEDAIDELVGQISEEEAKRVPADLSENLDHYLYGVPRP
jgi:hypothetical protein